MITVPSCFYLPHPFHCTHDIDAGNTAIKVFSVQGCRRFTTAEILKNPAPLLQYLAEEKATGILWRSSLPPLVEEEIKAHLIKFPLFSVQKQDLIPHLKQWRYKTSELGLDRMINLLLSRRQKPENDLVILSLGTATTVDFIQNDRHLGGWIQGGLRCWQNTLYEAVPHLSPFRPDPKHPINTENGLGLDTSSALAVGAEEPYLWGLMKTVESRITALNSLDGAIRFHPTLISTGGDAECLYQNPLIKTFGWPLEPLQEASCLSLFT
jgi:pantothenate kinase type III